MQVLLISSVHCVLGQLLNLLRVSDFQVFTLLCPQFRPQIAQAVFATSYCINPWYDKGGISQNLVAQTFVEQFSFMKRGNAGDFVVNIDSSVGQVVWPVPIVLFLICGSSCTHSTLHDPNAPQKCHTLFEYSASTCIDLPEKTDFQEDCSLF